MSSSNAFGDRAFKRAMIDFNGKHGIGCLYGGRLVKFQVPNAYTAFISSLRLPQCTQASAKDSGNAREATKHEWKKSHDYMK